MASWFAATLHRGRSRRTTRRALVLPLTAVFVLSMQAVVLSSGIAELPALLGSDVAVGVPARHGRRRGGVAPGGAALPGDRAVRRRRPHGRVRHPRRRVAVRDVRHAGDHASACSRRAPRRPAAALVIFAFASKAGLAPFHAWLPEAHPRAPSHVSALMSGRDAEGGGLRPDPVHGRLLARRCPAAWGIALLALGLAGAAVAAIYANIARDIKRILAWSSVENIGLAFAMFGFRLVLRRRGLAGARRRGDGGALPAPARPRAVQGGPVPRRRRDHPRRRHTGRSKRSAAWPTGCRACRRRRWRCALAAAALPPFGSFAAEWMLVQAVLASLATRRADVVVTGVAVLVGRGLRRRAGGVRDGAPVLVRVPRRTAFGRPRARRWSPRPACGARSSSLAVGGPGARRARAVAPAAVPGPVRHRSAPTAAGTWAPSGRTGPAARGRRSAAAMAAALAARLAGAARARRAPRDVRRYHTWDCGQPIDATMEYTATGFSAPVRFFLRDIVRAEKHLVFRAGRRDRTRGSAGPDGVPQGGRHPRAALLPGRAADRGGGRPAAATCRTASSSSTSP